MILHHGQSISYICGTKATKTRTFKLKKHQAIVIRCACNGSRFFQCLSGEIKSIRFVTVPCNTRVKIIC